MSTEVEHHKEEAATILDSYRTEYYHQISVIDSLVSKSKHLLVFWSGLATLAFAILEGLAPPLDCWELGAILGFLASVIPMIKSAEWFWRSFQGETYEDISGSSRIRRKGRKRSAESGVAAPTLFAIC